MSIKNNLKREGIEPIYELDKSVTIPIIKNISHKLVTAFPNFYLDEDSIITKFLKLNMYKAKMREGMAEASYFHKNASIYFNEHIADEDLEEFAIHECLHYFQEVKQGNKLIRMGLTGTGLNEAAVQYISAKLIGITPDIEMYYGITMRTPSPSYYPLECALLNQLIYFTGEEIMCKSTLFSNDDFKNLLIKQTSPKIYKTIESGFNTILRLEEKIIKLNNKISLLDDGDSKFTDLTEKLSAYKDNISDTFIKVQNLIIENMFNYEFNNIFNLKDLDIFRRRLDKFKNIIGTTNDYVFFENYYIETMNKLEHKSNVLENGGIETAISNKHKFNIFIKIKNILFNNKNLKEEK